MFFVVTAHAIRCRLQGFTLRGWQAIQSRMQFGLWNFQRSQTGSIGFIETIGVFKHRRITTRLHIFEDIGDHLVNGVILRGLESQQRFQFSIKTGITCI